MSILLSGEPPLVEEFSKLCESRPYSVFLMPGSGDLSAARTTKTIRRIRSIARGIALAVELTNVNQEQKEQNLRTIEKNLPSSIPILSTSMTISVAQQAKWLRHNDKLIGCSALPSLLNNRLIEVAPSLHTSQVTLSQIKNFLWDLGLEISVVQDRIGLVLPRILCMLINEAAFAVMEEAASAEDIDIAMKLGTNYPIGPIEWGEKLGFDQVVAILDALQRDVGGDRYRVAPLLRQLAVTGIGWGEAKGR